MRRFLMGLALALACGVIASCSGSDDGSSGEDACFWTCDMSAGFSRTCVSQPKISSATCQQMAADSCGSASMPVGQVEQQSGCSCPSSNNPDGCQSPPAWFWGNACFFQCEGEAATCKEYASGSGEFKTEADCQQAAQDACSGSGDAGAVPPKAEFQAGCGCPTFGKLGECTTPPSWYP